RRRDADEMRHDPVAADHGRRAAGLRRRREDAALPEQPSSLVECLAELDASEMAALDPRDPVMFREAVVDERVVRREQLERASALAQNAVEEELRLPPEGLPQVVVEIRILVDDGLVTVEVAEREPLSREILGERLRARVLDHAAHLRLEHLRVRQLVAFRELEQLVVRHAAPKEERQARREREGVDLVELALANVVRLELEAVDELRIHQRALQGHLDASLESAGLPALLVEAHQRADILLRVEAAIRTERERRD